MFRILIGATAAALGLNLFAVSAQAHTPLSSQTLDRIRAIESTAVDRRSVDRDILEGRGTVTVGPPGQGCDFVNDLQAAIDNSTAGTIRVANGGDYTGDTYFIQNRTVLIEGGYESCSSPQPGSTRTVLDADGEDRVFFITTDPGFDKVWLINFQITGGSGLGAGGGGILISGVPDQLSVELENVEITGNQTTGDGGGIRVIATGEGVESPDPTLLNIIADQNQDVFIHNNHADGDGGGIACASQDEQFVWPTVRFAGGIIGANSAENGGGIASSGCSMRIYPTATSVFGGIVNNTAADAGGGLYLADGGLALILGGGALGFGQPGWAGLISNNQATRGGGMAVDPDKLAQAESVVIHGNQADFGGGVYVRGSGATFVMNPGDTRAGACGEQSGFGGWPDCNRLSNNVALSQGPAIVVREGGSGFVSHAIMTGNFRQSTSGGVPNVGSVGYAIGASDLIVRSSLVTDNGPDNRVFSAANGATLKLEWSTVAGNLDATEVFAAPAPNSVVRVVGSIVWQPGADLFAGADATREVLCLIGEPTAAEVLAAADMDALIWYSSIDPEFADPAQGDLRLGPTSPAIDYCELIDLPSQPVDLDLNRRGQEYTGGTTNAPNPGDGLYDLGAWERMIDRFFSDRFEVD